jgi:hypothetical protein
MCPVRNVTHVSGRSGPPFRGLARRICARLSKDRDPVVFSEAMGKAFRRLSGTGRAEVKPLGYGGWGFCPTMQAVPGPLTRTTWAAGTLTLP